MESQKYQKVLKNLSDRIFSGQIKADTKLPTEVELSREMGVDRTSLRVALKQLEFLNVLDIRQGDGIYVRDFIKHAGMDFLRIVFSGQNASDKEGNDILDAYMIDEILEFWIEFLPSMLRLTAEKFSPRDIRSLQALYDEQLLNIGNKSRLVELEMQAQTRISEIADNMIMRFVINSTLPLREKMMEIFYYGFDEETIKKDIEIRKDLFNAAFSGSDEKKAGAIECYKQILMSYRKKVREIKTDSDKS